MWFEDFNSVVVVLTKGTICFIGLVFFLRLSGKRTLSKMNAFDFVMTVTMGSTLATTIISKDVTIVEGMAALGIIILVQYIIAWLEVRSDVFQEIIKSKPTVLFYEGSYQKDNLCQERITEVEVLASMRNNGMSDPAQVKAVILETDGRLSVIPYTNDKKDLKTLSPVSDFMEG
ncbi:MAG: hypothetical protein CMH28_09330 [Micavibrio sp.]|nr:hypothetical protein [Micavibrio sp.]